MCSVYICMFSNVFERTQVPAVPGVCLEWDLATYLERCSNPRIEREVGKPWKLWGKYHEISSFVSWKKNWEPHSAQELFGERQSFWDPTVYTLHPSRQWLIIMPGHSQLRRSQGARMMWNWNWWEEGRLVLAITSTRTAGLWQLKISGCRVISEVYIGIP